EPVAIMASSPPFSLAIVGAIAKRLWPRRVHLVVDMRDAWAMHSYLMGSRTIRRALERWVLRSADQVLTVSQGLCDEFAATHGVQVGLVYNVATHYFDNNGARAGLDWKSLDPAIDADAIKLVYTGSTPEGFYDLAGAAEAIAEVGNKGNLPRRFQFVLAGACQGLTDELRKRQLGPAQFVFIGHQPHSVARALQSECDALVFFAHKAPGNAGVVSTKFFEYLGTGRPILSIGVDEGSDVDHLLTTLCGRTMRLRTSESIADALRRVAAEGVGHLPCLNDEPGLRRLYGAYGAVIERLLTRAGAV
ncbi:MAG TPA: glycosyltransferase, partial [Gemmatimonadaceae bacterium]